MTKLKLTDLANKSIRKILRKGWIFDKNNEVVIIDGIAQRDINKDEELFYYGENLK